MFRAFSLSRRLPALAAAVLLFLALAAGPGQAQNVEEDELRGFAYSARIEGVDDEDLLEALLAAAKSFAQQDEPAASRFFLTRRARLDVDAMRDILDAYGFFAATITPRLGEPPAPDEPAELVFTVEPGPAFTYREVAIELSPSNATEPALQLPEPARFGLAPGQPFRAGDILDAAEKARAYAADHGHPLARPAQPRIVADHAEHRVDVRIELSPGPAARFGATRVEGLERLGPGYVDYFVPWTEGEAYNATQVQQMRYELLKTNLFSQVEALPPAEPEPGADTPVDFLLKERAPRTIKVSAGYSTDEKLWGKLDWVHRNLLGGGEKLKTGTEISRTRQLLDASLSRGNFLRSDQTLLLSAAMLNEETIAYDSRSTSFSANLEREIGEDITLSAGLGCSLSDVEKESRETFGLVFAPLAATWDTRDEELDATKGARLRLQLTPFTDTLGTGVRFLKTRIDGSHFLPLFESPRIVLANRAAYGVISGAGQESVPATERFYSGGGGSIRGYPYQTAGPISGDDPEGGLALLEFSSELRFLFTETLGFATFMDTGRAFSTPYPDPDQEFFWAVGAGLRYHTDLGPVRLDVAFPLNKRDKIDQPVQVYISLGQAF